jgi:hypothetical protein
VISWFQAFAFKPVNLYRYSESSHHASSTAAAAAAAADAAVAEDDPAGEHRVPGSGPGIINRGGVRQVGLAP